MSNCLTRSAVPAGLSSRTSYSSGSRVLGVFLGLFAFESLKMGANFIGRKQAPHFGDKSRKLPGEGRMVTGSAGEIHQFLADRIVERRLEPKALSDGPRRFALLDPNLMVFARTHRWFSLQSG